MGHRPRLLSRRRRSSSRRPVPADVLKAMRQARVRSRELAGSLWRRSGSQLPRLGGGHIRREGRRRRQGGLSAAAVRQRRAARSAQAGRSRQLRSGGPTDNVIPIWKVAAPALDIVAPDIYHERPRRVPEGAGTLSPRRQRAVRARRPAAALPSPGSSSPRSAFRPSASRPSAWTTRNAPSRRSPPRV